MTHIDATAHADPTVRMYDNTRIEDNAEVTGRVRMFGHARISGQARIGGLVTISGYSHITGTTVLNGQEQIHADGYITSNDDIFTSQPEGDQHVWTAHRTLNGGWTVHAGCVWHVTTDTTWTPENTTPKRLRPARQAHYLWVQQQCALRNAS